MFYFGSAVIYFVILQHFSFSISNANSLADDNLLIAFMKGHHEIQISEYSMQKYEAHLGIVYYMRTNWKCDKIWKQFDEFELKQCQKYHNYLSILYEFLYRKYIGIPTMKPKFALKNEQFEFDGPIINVINCLAKISQFYFNSKWSDHYDHILSNLFFYHFDTILLNEKIINYEEKKLEIEPKVPINEMILQLAIDRANECQESVDEIIQQNFEENLMKMLKNAEEKAKKGFSSWRNNAVNYDKHKIILRLKFDDSNTWIDDALFSVFVQGMATNYVKFSELVKGYSANLSLMKGKALFFGSNKFEKTKKHLTQCYEAHLGLMYLMGEKWHCANIGNEFEKHELKECQKYKKYLDIFYEYLFRLYAKTKNPDVANQLPALKPIFVIKGKIKLLLIDSVKKLNYISKFFWKTDEEDKAVIEDYIPNIDLLNEEEFSYEMKEEKQNLQNSLIKTSEKEQIEIVKIRVEFDQKMGKKYESTKENAKKEKEKLDKELKNNKLKEIATPESIYNAKFGAFLFSPFS